MKLVATSMEIIFIRAYKNLIKIQQIINALIYNSNKKIVIYFDSGNFLR